MTSSSLILINGFTSKLYFSGSSAVTHGEVECYIDVLSVIPSNIWYTRVKTWLIPYWFWIKEARDGRDHRTEVVASWKNGKMTENISVANKIAYYIILYYTLHSSYTFLQGEWRFLFYEFQIFFYSINITDNHTIT